MAIEDELSRAERALKDRLTNAGKVAKDITNKAFKELVASVKELNDELTKVTRDLEEQLDLYSEIKIQSQGYGKALQTALPFLKDNKDLAQKLVGVYKEQTKLEDKLVRYKEDLIAGELDYEQAAKAVAQSKNQQFAIDLSILNLQNEIESVGKEIAEANEADKVNLQAKKLSLQKVLSYLEAGIAPSTEDIANNFQKMANKAQEVEALTGTIFAGLKKTSIGKLIDFDSVTKAMKATKAGGASTFATLSTGAKAFGASLKAALGPIGLILIAAEAIQKAFELFVKASFAADKRVTEIAKNLSIGKEAARGIYDNLTDLKGTLDTEYATTENLVKAFGEIATLTEFSAIANKGQLETQIVLTNQLGQSVEEAQALQGIFAVNNVEADKGLDIVYDQIAAFANQNKIVADGRQILKQIQGVSKQILLNFKGNTGELVKTVLQANKLGLSLDQVDKIAGSLLDFEQSISAELNAELLTGRQLNLEKARLFALNNDIAGLTQEIANQGITAEKFAGMNRIQQQAIAQSLGLQASELGDALYKSKLIDQVAGDTTKKLREQAKLQEQKGNYEEANRLNARAAAIEQGIVEGKTLEQAQKSVDTQTKFNLALERAKEIFTDVIDGGLLDGLVSALEDIVISLESLGFGNGISYNTEELVKTAQQNNLSYTPSQIEEANQNFKGRSRGMTSLVTGNSQYSPIVSELEFLAETIDAIVPYSDVSYFNRDRQSERMLEEIKQSNEATQKAIQEQTQAIKADRQISVAVDGTNVFKAMNTSKYMS
jgi:hypothetical protein